MPEDRIEELKHLRIGDFVELGEAFRSQASFDNKHPIAVVTGSGNPGDEINQDYHTGHPRIIHFERGYQIEQGCGTGFVDFITRKVSTEDALAYFDLLMHQEDLRIAIAISRRHKFQTRRSKLGVGGSDAHTTLTASQEPYGTGIYVARGVYTDIDEGAYRGFERETSRSHAKNFAHQGKNLQAMNLGKSISSQELEEILNKSFRDGIGIIPKSFTRLRECRQEEMHLVDYDAFEAPREALYLVSNAQMIEPV